MPVGVMNLTGEQIRAARALARIEQTELAARTRLSLETIKRLERMRGRVEANSRTILAIFEAFESIGIFFDAREDGAVGVCRRREDAVTRPPAPVAGRVSEAERRGPLYRLIYFSTINPEATQDTKQMLDDIVRVSSPRNAQLGVTGALFACDGYFLQVLEGPKESVLQIYGSISTDPRHQDLNLCETRTVTVRHFQDWTMCCGLFSARDPMLAREPALKDGFKPQLLSAASALGLLSIVRDTQPVPPLIAACGHAHCTAGAACAGHDDLATAGWSNRAEA